MSLRRILVNVKDISQHIKFFGPEGLGLTILGSGDDWSVIETGSSILLHARSTYSEAELSKGYTPILQFNVSNLQNAMMPLMMMGASMDGAVEYSNEQTVVNLRSPCGLMVSLVEEHRLSTDEQEDDSKVL